MQEHLLDSDKLMNNTCILLQLVALNHCQLTEANDC